MALTSQKQRKGFTLVEILIVLAVVSILAALTLAVISRVRNTAYTTVCASNLHQIGLAMTFYANDYNRYYPAPEFIALPRPKMCGWLSRLVPYVKDTKVFECPAAKTIDVLGSYYSGDYRSDCPGEEKVDTDDGITEVHLHYGSYDIADMRTNSIRRVRDSSFQSPTSSGYVVDGFGTPPVNVEWVLKEDGRDVTYHGIPRHNDGANVLFGDMHVKWLGHDALDKPGLWSLQGTS